MISVAVIYNYVIDMFNRRIFSVYQYGPKNVYEAMPVGDDSAPIQGMTAIFAETDMDGSPVLVGYVNTKQLAEPGGKRLYSLNADTGAVAFYIWLHANGTMELGGTNDFAVRYNALNEALQQQIEKMQEQLDLISAGIAAAGGEYTPGDITLDISLAKIAEIKTL